MKKHGMVLKTAKISGANEQEALMEFLWRYNENYKTDNGSPFQSHRFMDFAKKWGFKHRRVTPEWPRARLPRQGAENG